MFVRVVDCFGRWLYGDMVVVIDDNLDIARNR
jgi:hypothetical protein